MRHPEVCRLPHFPQPIHQPAGGEILAIVPATQEGGQVHLDSRGGRGVPRAQVGDVNRTRPSTAGCKRANVNVHRRHQRVVSIVLVVERREEGKEQPVQRPVYYLNEVPSQSRQNYPHYQKLVYGVYYTAKRLRHYFQEYPIIVVCVAPLADIIGNKDATGRVAKWSIELAAHSILYEPRTAIKSQILADFFVEETQYLPSCPDSSYWQMHFDGSKIKEGLGVGIVLTSPKGDRLEYALQIHFKASNNVAEYEALVHGFKLAK